MSKSIFALSTIEILVLVGILGLMLVAAAKSYRAHLISIEINKSNSDFYNVEELIRKEFLEIKNVIEQQPNYSREEASQRLDSAQEWFELVKAKLDLKTKNVVITSIDGTIADENIVVKIGLRSEQTFLIKEKPICWDLFSEECL